MNTDNIGAQDGENALSEIHAREVRSFETHISGAVATEKQVLSWAGRNFAMARVWEAVAHLINAATTLGFAAGVTYLVKWWFG